MNIKGGCIKEIKDSEMIRFFFGQRLGSVFTLDVYSGRDHTGYADQ